MLRRLLSVVTAAVIMAAMMAGGAGAAMAAGNPTHKLNPYAELEKAGGQGGSCVQTYTGPTSPPGSDARGGNPGYEENKQVGHGCEGL